MQITILVRHHDGGRPRTGDAILACLAASDVLRFDFSVAFVTEAGVRRLGPRIQQLISRGGRASGIVGVDQESTTLEGLQMLLDLNVTVDVLHSPNDVVYHPKLYVVRAEHSASAFIGSSNMTVGGLFRNIEGDVRVDLDLRLASDVSMLAALDDAFDRMRARTSSCRRLDAALLRQLSQAGLLRPESTASRALQGNGRGIEIFSPLGVPPAPRSTEVSASAPSEIRAERRQRTAPKPPATAPRPLARAQFFENCDPNERSVFERLIGFLERIEPHGIVWNTRSFSFCSEFNGRPRRCFVTAYPTRGAKRLHKCNVIEVFLKYLNESGFDPIAIRAFRHATQKIGFKYSTEITGTFHLSDQSKYEDIQGLENAIETLLRARDDDSNDLAER